MRLGEAASGILSRTLLNLLAGSPRAGIHEDKPVLAGLMFADATARGAICGLRFRRVVGRRSPAAVATRWRVEANPPTAGRPRPLNGPVSELCLLRFRMEPLGLRSGS